MMGFARMILVVVLAVGSTGCSSFNREWKRAATAPSPSRVGMEGRWEGTWRSGKNDHHGALRCLITHQTNNVYTARFHAKYRRLFNLSFGYTAQLEARPAGSEMLFRGKADLGWYAGGMYHYEGKAGATDFISNYACEYDHGTFEMRRIQ